MTVLPVLKFHQGGSHSCAKAICFMMLGIWLRWGMNQNSRSGLSQPAGRTISIAPMWLSVWDLSPDWWAKSSPLQWWANMVCVRCASGVLPQPERVGAVWRRLPVKVNLQNGFWSVWSAELTAITVKQSPCIPSLRAPEPRSKTSFISSFQLKPSTSAGNLVVGLPARNQVLGQPFSFLFSNDL